MNKAIGVIAILCAIAFSFSLIGMIIALSTKKIGVASEEWEKTEGLIISSHDERHNNPSYRHVYLKYEFTVNGEKYTGNRYRIQANHSFPKEEAEKIVAELKAGNSIPIYFDKEEPSRSTIVKGVSGSLQDHLSWMTNQTFVLTFSFLLTFGYWLWIRSR